MNAKHTKIKKRTQKEILDSLKKNSKRIDFNGVLYFKVCDKACTTVKHTQEKLDKLYKSSPPKKSQYRRYTLEEKGLSDKIREQDSVAIVFAAMCLEACIWDYAACGMSNNKAEEIFESLNLVAKWIVIPKFFCGKDITQLRIDGTNLLGRLRKLIKARNRLVHPKSKLFPDNVYDAIKALRAEGRKEITGEDAFNLISLLLGELEKVDETNWWFFQSDKYKNSIKKAQESTTS